MVSVSPIKDVRCSQKRHLVGLLVDFRPKRGSNRTAFHVFVHGINHGSPKTCTTAEAEEGLVPLDQLGPFRIRHVLMLIRGGDVSLDIVSGVS